VLFLNLLLKLLLGVERDFKKWFTVTVTGGSLSWMRNGNVARLQVDDPKLLGQNLSAFVIVDWEPRDSSGLIQDRVATSSIRLGHLGCIGGPHDMMGTRCHIPRIQRLDDPEFKSKCSKIPEVRRR